MKIAVFSDIHGSVTAMETVVDICKRTNPNKVVICGDLFGGWVNQPSAIVNLVGQIDAVTYLVKGNNDRQHDIALLTYEMEDNAVMYHFNRTLFFTHGDVYNKYRMPPILKEGDALIYGHTHTSLLQRYNGLFVLNVGSVARPRDNMPCYLILDDNGATLYDLYDNVITSISWQN
ncbi:MAG: YfcE family phosphodiesterase [Clostridia bacterium]|nr:YfcE family phosphodiesterase [Clostridia bacterium]